MKNNDWGLHKTFTAWWSLQGLKARQQVIFKAWLCQFSVKDYKPKILLEVNNGGFMQWTLFCWNNAPKNTNLENKLEQAFCKMGFISEILHSSIVHRQSAPEFNKWNFWQFNGNCLTKLPHDIFQQRAKMALFSHTQADGDKLRVPIINSLTLRHTHTALWISDVTRCRLLEMNIRNWTCDFWEIIL